MKTESGRNGKIVTFYSYKGGTGRTMALANVAWILASNGKRVLLIDWDFEAPGLHRYLHPFLDDKELTATPGLIDFFVDFAMAARVAHSATESTGQSSPDWFEPYTSLVPYTVPVNWDHFGEGALELVPAGRQDAGYSVNVTSYDWQGFYAKGGGLLLEALKRRLRQDYDFIFIDSRTGISDTSGICTVQMPDELIVFFTLNQQSMKGAAATADAADRMRRKSTGEPGLRIWPVPTRVVHGEADRLEAARDECRAMFERHIGHFDREKRAAYWGTIEIPQIPLYAYEETLAPFAERRQQTLSLLGRMEELATLIHGEPPVRMAKMPEDVRQDVLERFRRKRSTAPTRQSFAFMNYSRKEARVVEAIADKLREQDVPVWIDSRDIPTGADWRPAVEGAVQRSAVVIFFIGPSGVTDQRMAHFREALKLGKRVLPVLIEGAYSSHVPPELQSHTFSTVRGRGRKVFPEDVNRLAKDLWYFLSGDSIAPDPDDPQKGRFGHQPVANGRELSATVVPITADFFELTLDVHAVDGTALAGNVEFHLHPTFARPMQIVPVQDGRATLKLQTWGAFTVGAVADNGRTSLELDLAQNPSFPEVFRSR